MLRGRGGVHYIKIQAEQNDLVLRFLTGAATSYVTEVHKIETLNTDDFSAQKRAKHVEKITEEPSNFLKEAFSKVKHL